MSRIYIFTGKGGVGKTSVSAAHAVLSAGFDIMLNKEQQKVMKVVLVP